MIKPPRGKEEAELIIRKITYDGFIYHTRHFRDRMREKNFEATDLEYLLETGELKWPPDYNPETGDWKYRIEGKDTEGADAVVIIVIHSRNEVECITIF